MNRIGRQIIEPDWNVLVRTLNQSAKINSRYKRLRAAIFLSISSGIRLSELLALQLVDALDRIDNGWRVREIIFLTPEKAKKFLSKNVRSTASGKIYVDDPARAAIRDYLSSTKTNFRPESFLFFSTDPSCRLTGRALEYGWAKIQLRAGITSPRGPARYRWHDLRHTALTRIGEQGNTFDVIALGRFKSAANAARYVHPSDDRIFSLLSATRR